MTDRFMDRYRPQKLSEIIGASKVVAQLGGLLERVRLLAIPFFYLGLMEQGRPALLVF